MSAKDQICEASKYTLQSADLIIFGRGLLVEVGVELLQFVFEGFYSLQLLSICEKNNSSVLTYPIVLFQHQLILFILSSGVEIFSFQLCHSALSLSLIVLARQLLLRKSLLFKL
jgi:hypothetical protein